MAESLTNRRIKELMGEASSSGKRIDVPDGGCAGLILRLGVSGTGTWCFRYGKCGRRLTLGKFPHLTLQQARDSVALHRGKIASGVDPISLKRDMQTAATIADLAARFEKEHYPKLAPKTEMEYKLILKHQILPHLGHIKIKSLERPEVIRWHQAQRDTPRRANLALAVLSKMMSLAELWGERPESNNPCRLVPRFDEKKRQRYLNPEELKKIIGLISKDDYLESQAIKLLLLTGMRRGELLGLTWDNLDLAQGLVHLPEHKIRKQMGTKTLPLPCPAVEIFASLPHHLGLQKVFPLSYSALNAYWCDIRTKAGLKDVHLHDLRHTFASYSISLGKGVTLAQVGQLLGHRDQSTTQRYAHLVIDPLREAVERTAERIQEAWMEKEA